MKQILTFVITLFSLATFGQKVGEVLEQKMTIKKWNEEAKTNFRLLPKYGYALKTKTQNKYDKKFIKTVLKEDTSNRNASDDFISFGFKHLYNDLRTAMYRFNQAYLLDSSNTNIYWGFGAVYFILGDYVNAKKQYEEGLGINPANTHLLTDYGTCFLVQYYTLQPLNEKVAFENLDSAITYMSKSYQLDPSDQSTTFKLSNCYINKKDCINAWKYYNICKASGGKPITEDFTNDIIKRCQQKE